MRSRVKEKLRNGNFSVAVGSWLRLRFAGKERIFFAYVCTL